MIVIYLRWMMVLLLALILTILPLPAFLSACRPPWVLLLFFYTLFFFEFSMQWIGLFAAGLLLDVLQASLIGEHVFALSIALWIASIKRWRFNHFSINQQMAFVGIVCWFYQAALLFISVCWEGKFSIWQIGVEGVVSSVLGAVCWPWIKVVLNDFLMRRNHAVR